MGECDRFKPFISDYLEKNLDPTTHQKFEKALADYNKIYPDKDYHNRIIYIYKVLLSGY